jgi:hypothetical protein
MNARVLPPRWHSRPLPPRDWRQQFERWCARLEACALKPGRRRVHALRVETLRLQAELSSALQGAALDAPTARLERRWAHSARKTRLLLAPVRDADVYLELLGSFCGPGAQKAALESPEARDCLQAVVRLERLLRRRRATDSRRMVAGLRTRLRRMADEARALGRALASSGQARVCQRAALQALMSQLAAAAPTLAASGLHAFRKLARTGRYLAESEVHPDAWTRHAAQTCRAIQKTAGLWRDWSALARLARRHAARDADRVLARDMEATASRLLSQALVQCRQAVTPAAARAGAEQKLRSM